MTNSEQHSSTAALLDACHIFVNDNNFGQTESTIRQTHRSVPNEKKKKKITIQSETFLFMKAE